MLRLVLALLTITCVLQTQSSHLTETEVTIQQAIEAGQLGDASRLVDAALKQYPRQAGLLNLRGIIHAQRKEWSDAHSDFADAVHAEPDLTAAWQNLARACQLEAEERVLAPPSCATDGWLHVLRSKPQDMEAHTSLAVLYEKLGNYLNSLQQIDSLSPDTARQTSTLTIRCADLCGLHRIPEALAAANQLSSRADFSDRDFITIQSALQSPKSAAVVVVLVEALDARQAASLADLQKLALAYEQLQRRADARKLLERVALADPTNSAHLLELARLAEDGKDHEGALGYLAHARDLAPDNPRIHFLFGIIAAEMDLPVEARHSLDRALALDPQNADYNFAMGSVILSTRDAATASSYFQNYVRAKPKDPKGHYALGVAYFAAGDYEKTRQEMVVAQHSLQATAGAQYFLGRIARMQGDLDDASRCLHKSVDLMPSFSEAHTELARVLLEQGKVVEAHKELDRAIALDPNSFQGNAQLLVLYRRTHDPRAAKQEEILKQLDENRSRRAELMLRTIEVRP